MCSENSQPLTERPAPADRTLMAAGLTLIYAVTIGFTDNHVRTIAAEAGLWQFHAVRSVMAMAILACAAPLLGLRVWPKNWRPVLLRSVLHAAAMMLYFGTLAFLPVALVAAGLFTAPIFVLLINRFALGGSVSAAQIIAVALGFCGVVLVLGPQALSGASYAAMFPVLAAVLYGLGNIATRQWCEGESAATLLAGFFIALGICGAVGLGALTLFPLIAPAGADGFVLRGPTVLTGTFLFWTFVQAAGSLFGVGMAIRAYQLTAVGRAAVLEYLILPASAIWAYVLWGQTLGLSALAGMALIAVAGALIALKS
ncbi:MAG: DMT family transporter [Cypionkella sp.]|nr:DMT family transporter [Cypionkella sp.]